MDFHFKPMPGAFPDNILRVAPDILPPGSIRLDAVWVNGKKYDNFDAEALTVTLPASTEPLKVRVRISPAAAAQGFFSSTELVNGVAKINMGGTLTAADALAFKADVDRAIATKPKALALIMNDLYSISPEGVRVLVFASEQLGVDVNIYGIGACDAVLESFREMEFDDDMEWRGDYDPAEIEGARR